MHSCWKVPAEAWRQLRDARWEKLQKADFYQCLGKGWMFFRLPCFLYVERWRRVGCPPSTWGVYHLQEPPAQVFRRRLPGRRGGRYPPRRVGAVQRPSGHTRRRSCSGLWIQTRPLTRLAPIRPFSGFSGAHRGMFSILAMGTTRS